MRDVGRFVLRFGLGLLVIFGIVFWRVSHDGLATADALFYAIIGSLAVMTVAVLLVWGTALVGGWGARRRALRKTHPASPVLAVVSSEDLQHHVRQFEGVPPLLQIPWGLSLVVTDAGVEVWAGRSHPYELLRFPWWMVHSVQPAPALRRWDGEWCLNVEILTPKGLIPLRFILMGSFPFGAQPASLHTATDAARRLVQLRNAVHPDALRVGDGTEQGGTDRERHDGQEQPGGGT